MELYPFQGILLDKILESGNYRMHQNVFTTDIICMNDDVYGVYWLRIKLAEIAFSKSQLRIQQLNRHFKIEISTLHLTNEMIQLYSHHRASIHFDHVQKLEDYLFDSSGVNRFYSKQICIYDNTQLIAVGIFDEGNKSIAGIINFFDPNYKKHSLGKYLMYLKCQYAMAHQMEFYYPGYIAVGYTKFDYKIYPNKEAVEILDTLGATWLPYSDEILAALNARFDWFINWNQA